jgi:hypothetical protein
MPAQKSCCNISLVTSQGVAIVVVFVVVVVVVVLFVCPNCGSFCLPCSSLAWEIFGSRMLRGYLLFMALVKNIQDLNETKYLNISKSTANQQGSTKRPPQQMPRQNNIIESDGSITFRK